MRIAIGIYLLVHGFCHFVGFVVPWKIVTMKDEPYKTTLVVGSVDVGDVGIRIVGLLWLIAGVAFLAAALGVFASWSWWRTATLWFAIASLVLCVLGLPGAKIGILANALILAYLLGARFGWLPAVG
ncbi:MAG TPA: ABC transporter permease [Polyangia bacterium]|jgi:hypothetical protein|nr:ABC transporter permease [Polyangia bacterium]